MAEESDRVFIITHEWRCIVLTSGGSALTIQVQAIREDRTQMQGFVLDGCDEYKPGDRVICTYGEPGPWKNKWQITERATIGNELVK